MCYVVGTLMGDEMNQKHFMNDLNSKSDKITDNLDTKNDKEIHDFVTILDESPKSAYVPISHRPKKMPKQTSV